MLSITEISGILCFVMFEFAVEILVGCVSAALVRAS